MDITKIIISVIGLLSVIVTYVIVPMIKAKKTTEEVTQLAEKTALITKWVITAVNAAEMFFKAAGSGEEKNSYVLDFIEKKCEDLNVTFNADEVSAEIEEIGQNLGLWSVKKDEIKPE